MSVPISAEFTQSEAQDKQFLAFFAPAGCAGGALLRMAASDSGNAACLEWKNTVETAHADIFHFGLATD